MNMTFSVPFFFSLLCLLIAGRDLPITNEPQPQQSSSQPQRYLVLVLHRLGLANRLRSVADWYQVAILSNRVLIVDWHATSDCNATFTDLFESAPDRLKVLPYILPLDPTDAIASLEATAREENVTYITLDKDSMFSRGHDSFILRRDEVMSDAGIVFTSYDGVLALDGVKCQQYLSMRSDLLSALVPVKEARLLANEVIDTYFRDKIMIGVHYRAHDRSQDWEVVPPLDGQTSAVPFGVGATLQDFQRYMSDIETAFTTKSTVGEGDAAVVVSSKASRFFIASNSQEAKEFFAMTFKDSVFMAGDYSRSSKEGIHFALLEWLLLSRSALIMNTYGSSYAMEAAQVHLRPLVGIWGGVAVHHTDIRLPFCGHMLYMKEFSNKATDTVYTEGTKDRREVCHVLVFILSLYQCKFL